MLLKIEFTNDDAKNTYKNGELLNYSTTGSSGFDIRAISILLPKNGNVHHVQRTWVNLKENLVNSNLGQFSLVNNWIPRKQAASAI